MKVSGRQVQLSVLPGPGKGEGCQPTVTSQNLQRINAMRGTAHMSLCLCSLLILSVALFNFAPEGSNHPPRVVANAYV